MEQSNYSIILPIGKNLSGGKLYVEQSNKKSIFRYNSRSV